MPGELFLQGDRSEKEFSSPTDRERIGYFLVDSLLYGKGFRVCILLHAVLT